MNNLDVYKARINAIGGNTAGRNSKNKLSSLNYIIYKEGLGEKIKYQNQDYDVLITQINTENYNISAPNSLSLSIGSLIYRYKDNSHWLVLNKNKEDAYFSGSITKAEHQINWKIDNNIYMTYAAQIKNLSLKVTNKNENSFVFTAPDNTITLLLPYNDDTKTLKLYNSLMLKQKPFEITNIDTVSYDNIMVLSLKQIPIDIYNDDIDNNLARVGQRDTTIITLPYSIEGASEVDELLGLTQEYIISTPVIDGYWSFDSNYGAVIYSDNERIQIQFNNKKFGEVYLYYKVLDEIKAQIKINILPLI